MSYRAGKLITGSRPYSPNHSPRVSACKLIATRVRPLWRTATCATSVESTSRLASCQRLVTSGRPSTERHVIPSRDPPPLDQRSLITQVYAGQQDLPTREFGSCFDDPLCRPSHETNGISDLPLYSTYPQSLKWNSAQLTKIAHDYKCRCTDCRSPHCPENISRLPNNSTDTRNFRFKNNIMTFCDQNTMTCKVNDVSCGICLGIGCIQTENKCIEASPHASKPYWKSSAATRRKPCAGSLEPPTACAPPPAKRVRHYRPKHERRKTAMYLHCATAGCQMRREEAVRDSNPMINTCCNQLDDDDDDNYKSSLIDEEMDEMSRDQLDSTQPSARKTLYNEGISDDIANNLPLQVHQRRPCTPPVRKTSNVSVGRDNWIPYGHRGTSRYHSECKKTPEVRYRSDCAPGDHYRAPECLGGHHRKKPPAKCPNASAHPYYAQPAPRKVLTSANNIDSYLQQL